MRNRIHLCLLSADDVDRVQVCAHGSYWMWPTLEAAVRRRLPMVGSDFLARRVRAQRPCCVTFPATEDGSFLDWLAVYVVDTSSLLDDCSWTSLSALDTRVAVMPYQARALEWYRAGLRRARAPGAFETPGMLDAVHRWVRQSVGGARQLEQTRAVFRLTAHEAVIRFDASPRPVYFKASHFIPFPDADITQAIAHIARDRVPVTLAHDVDRGWWLVDHVDGLSFEHRWSAATALDVVSAVRDLQLALANDTETLISAGAPLVTPSLLQEALRDIAHVAAARPTFPLGELERGFVAAEQALSQAEAATWNHGDLAGQNIAVANGRITFIDQELACVGPAFLSAPRLAKTCEMATGTPGWLERSLSTLEGDPSDSGATPGRSRAESRAVQVTCEMASLARNVANLRQRQERQEFSASLDVLVLKAAENAARAAKTLLD